MAYYSKITIFSISLLLTLLLDSCKKDKNDVIPDVYVDFTIDIDDPEFVNLNAIGGSDIVDYNTNNLGQRAAGFDGNGIIITRAVDRFYAYDRTCPHDYVVNSLSIKVNIDVSYFTLAKCPECETEYSLLTGGIPSSGVGRYPLKNYKTSFDGRFIRVWNY